MKTYINGTCFSHQIIFVQLININKLFIFVFLSFPFFDGNIRVRFVAKWYVTAVQNVVFPFWKRKALYKSALVMNAMWKSPPRKFSSPSRALKLRIWFPLFKHMFARPPRLRMYKLLSRLYSILDSFVLYNEASVIFSIFWKFHCSCRFADS